MNKNKNLAKFLRYFFPGLTLILLFILLKGFLGSDTEKIDNLQQIKQPNSYTFFINAENITIDVVNNALFSSTMSRITISIVNYSSGSVNVRVIDPQSISRFNYFGSDDENLFTETLNGYVPQSVGIKTINFSGKLKIQLTKTF